MKEVLWQILTDYGCEDISGTMQRFLDDDEFFEAMLKELLGDPGFEQLGKDLEGTDVKASFETAHMLKGIIANCGLTPMLNTINMIVEPLRIGKMNGLKPAYQQLLKQKQLLMDLLATV